MKLVLVSKIKAKIRYGVVNSTGLNKKRVLNYPKDNLYKPAVPGWVHWPLPSQQNFYYTQHSGWIKGVTSEQTYQMINRHRFQNMNCKYRSPVTTSDFVYQASYGVYNLLPFSSKC